MRKSMLLAVLAIISVLVFTSCASTVNESSYTLTDEEMVKICFESDGRNPDEYEVVFVEDECDEDTLVFDVFYNGRYIHERRFIDKQRMEEIYGS